ncbi:MAG: NAD-dependent epimerase/dehydratase family protein [Actinobacteria bacterium]|nr:NAD-dependent epimerase/dehydratase family protein [Actinomycetota bacterium]
MRDRILVTGGGGVVGGAIVRALLAQGHTVRSFSRGDHRWLRELGVETVRGDVADLAAVESAAAGCDAVVHAAAKADITVDPAPFITTNVVGTANVIAACRRRDVGRLVFTSTPSVVHDGRPIEGADESLPYATRFEAAYPATKARAEQLVLAANDDDLATVALRPHLVWGPGDEQLTGRIIARARAGRLRLVDHGHAVVDATYIDDAAAAHLLALTALASAAGRRAVGGGALFIASGHPLPIATLINGVLGAAGLPAERRSVPFPVAHAAGVLCEALWRATRRRTEPPMTRVLARQLATSHWFDLTAARRDLGYRPSVAPDDGFERLAAALRGR